MKKITAFLAALSLAFAVFAAFPFSSDAADGQKPAPRFIDFSLPEMTSYFSGAHDVTVQSVEDPDHGRAVKISTSRATIDPYVTFNYKKFVTAQGIEQLSADDYKAVVLKFKQSGCSDAKFELFYYTGRITWAVAGNSVLQNYDSTATGWQYVIFDMSTAANWKGIINGFRFDFMYTGGAAGESITVGKIFFMSSLYDLADALASEVGVDPNGVTEDETARAEALINSVSDPAPVIPNAALTAEYEDQGIDLWFDHAFAKTPAGSCASTGLHT
ncbi:MAG: hypothetical protein IJU57_00675 [Clostridia bacterium]|nr:hypothetical protein [Clostridia bacterium]